MTDGRTDGVLFLQVNMEIRSEALKSLSSIMCAYAMRCFYEKVSIRVFVTESVCVPLS